MIGGLAGTAVPGQLEISAKGDRVMNMDLVSNAKILPPHPHP